MPLHEDRPLRLLLSFSPQDRDLAEQLHRHLQVLVRFGGISLWSADRVRAGDDWRQEGDAALEYADVAILLISADFLASEFLQDVEVPKLFQRHEQGGLKVIPVVIRSCLWQVHPWLCTLKPLPVSGNAIASFEGDGRDRALTEVVAEIAERAGNLQANKEYVRNGNRTRQSASTFAISYHQSDVLCRTELKSRLDKLIEDGILRTSDSLLTPVDAEISVHLLSAAYLDLIDPDHFERLLVRHDNNEIRMIPVVVRPCHWKLTRFSVPVHGM